MASALINGIDIAYDEFGETTRPAIMLIMGLGNQMIGWPEPFCEALAARGFRVVRFDNRDIGLSTKFDEAEAVDLARAFARVVSGEPIKAPYTLHDMAIDAVGLMDEIGIHKAHIVGASMGGMIAQIVAADHANRASSLVSIMSSSGDPKLPTSKPEAVAALFSPRPSIEDRDRVIQHGMNVLRTIGSPSFPTSDAELRAKVVRAMDRSYYPQGVGRQFLAMLANGSRVEMLRRIRVPTLVIHGSDDPLVPVEAGNDMAANIPGAKLKIIAGMGHDLATGLIPILVDAIAEHCEQVNMPDR
jgi:pimeloyl-ACP methyl ester carboxylesterase